VRSGCYSRSAGFPLPNQRLPFTGLLAIYHPDDYDPSTEDEAMSRDIDALTTS
jgi:hypothetical protein